MIASLNDRSHALTDLLRSLPIAYTRTCIHYDRLHSHKLPTSKSGRGLSSHMLFIGALSAPYHITANTLENVIALVILFTFQYLNP